MGLYSRCHHTRYHVAVPLPEYANSPALPGLTQTQLLEALKPLSLPRWRIGQIATWVYQRGAQSYAVMTDLPASLRDALPEHLTWVRPDVRARVDATDGSHRLVLAYEDRREVECVVLPYARRTAICVSTQVGCHARCRFCATGQMGFTRNLSAAEIVAQVLTAQHETQVSATHIVFMGMGEPLWNTDAVLHAIEVLNHEIGISQRRITVSTIGVVPEIHRLIALRPAFTLALSLHAPDDALRRRLMPATRHWTVAETLQCLSDYTLATGRKCTIEYVLIDTVNDSADHARQLAALVRPLTANVNLIPVNPAPGSPYTRPPQETIRQFGRILAEAGVPVVVRRSRGTDINAACGQLQRNHKINEHHK